MKDATIVLSGGQDSVTCLIAAMHDPDVRTVNAITFDYGQRHAIELSAARNVFALARTMFPEKMGRHQIVKIPAAMLHTAGCSLTDAETEVSTFEPGEKLPDGIQNSFVPYRNAVFLTLAASRARAYAAEDRAEHMSLLTGVSGVDNGGYPDCRPEFITALQYALHLAVDGDGGPALTIDTPLIHLSKRETVELAASYGSAAFSLLAFSHTAYDGAYPPGTDHASVLRRAGFEAAGLPDPLEMRWAMEAHDTLPEKYEGYPELLGHIAAGAAILGA